MKGRDRENKGTSQHNNLNGCSDPKKVSFPEMTQGERKDIKNYMIQRTSQKKTQIKTKK